jgi:fructose-specific phosphotransferase system IIC component
MDILIGTLLLLIVLVFFTVFSYKAPYGMKAMGALANAAVVSYLVEAFQKYIGGDIIGFSFLGELGHLAGGMAGVAAAALVCLALGVSPVYSLMMGVACAEMGLLPGFFAGYIVAFLVKVIEKRFPAGLDLLGTVIIAAPLARFIAVEVSPLVDATLLKIGGIIDQITSSSPILMGIILGGIITVVATSPLSSMALTAMLGLVGLPMGISSVAIVGSAFLNYVLFDRLKFGSRKTTIAMTIEPLTQADLVAANPIPIYVTNFVGGALSGIVVALFGLINNATGTATVVAGLVVMYGFNDPIKVTICVLICGVIGIVCGLLGSYVFRNFKIVREEEVRGRGQEVA